ncbi:hypothetical protein [uncultured Zoogloea sp.]|uniref:hypothetical protein n=1 Tax=uncultured Zoogloea sp. TaxID=160237 RepID=UPI0026148C7A|nr:hypothetical protein [uncultured Zoogloea sp.]
MNWQDLAKKVAPLAPAIGTALAGPAGAVAGGLVASRLGVAPTPTAIANAIAGDPAAEEKLAAAELELARLITADVQDARAAHREHWMPAALTILLTLMMGAFVGALLFVAIPDGNLRVVDTAFGAMLGAFTTAIAFWLGSSRSSVLKS